MERFLSGITLTNGMIHHARQFAANVRDYL